MPLTARTRALFASVVALPRIWQAAVYAGLGAVAGLGQAPFDLPWAFVAAVTVIMALASITDTPRRAFGMGWVFGAGYFALTLHWIVQPFLIEPEIYGWMAPFALVLMAGGLGLFWATAFGVAKRLFANPAWFLLSLVVVWSLVEVFRSYAFTGFPWVLPGHIWINSNQVQLAAWIGPHGLGVLTLAVCAAMAWGLGRGSVIWALPLIALAGIGPVLDPGPAADATGPLVRIIQPNAPQQQKFDPDYIPVFQNRLMTATAASPRADLVVWPETAVPYLLEWSDDILAAASDLSGGAPIITGINRRAEGRYFNSLIVTGFGGAVTAVYDKEHLVPFGEYLPFGEIAAKLGLHGLAASEGGGYTAGQGRDLIDIPGLGSARVLICYEASFAEEILPRGDARPDVLVLITNDAWFGTFAGPYQHLAHARLRAVEQGLPLIRAANTGISAMIDGKGRVLGSLPLGVSGHLDHALPKALAPTLYARTGDWPGLVALGFAALFLAIRRRRIPIDLPPIAD